MSETQSFEIGFRSPESDDATDSNTWILDEINPEDISNIRNIVERIEKELKSGKTIPPLVQEVISKFNNTRKPEEPELTPHLILQALKNPFVTPRPVLVATRAFINALVSNISIDAFSYDEGSSYPIFLMDENGNPLGEAELVSGRVQEAITHMQSTVEAADMDRSEALRLSTELVGMAANLSKTGAELATADDLDENSNRVEFIGQLQALKPLELQFFIKLLARILSVEFSKTAKAIRTLTGEKLNTQNINAAMKRKDDTLLNEENAANITDALIIFNRQVEEVLLLLETMDDEPHSDEFAAFAESFTNLSPTQRQELSTIYYKRYGSLPTRFSFQSSNMSASTVAALKDHQVKRKAVLKERADSDRLSNLEDRLDCRSDLKAKKISALKQNLGLGGDISLANSIIRDGFVEDSERDSLMTVLRTDGLKGPAKILKKFLKFYVYRT